MQYRYILLIVLAAIVLVSCNDEVTGTYGAKPMAMGRLNDLVVIADNDVWEGMPGDTFRHYFESAYPIMPNPEPMFDLRHFTTKELSSEPLRQELRTYVILADLSDTDSPTTSMVRKDIGEERFIKAKSDPTFVSTVGKDKWARGQIVIYLFAKNEPALAASTVEKFPAIADRVRHHDEQQLLASIYAVKQESAGAISKIKSLFGLDIKIPGDYEIIMNKPDENIFWLRSDAKDASSNIVIRSFDYTSPDQLATEYLIGLRDNYGKAYISGPSDNSYMVTNTTDLPIYDYTYDINGLYTKEIRGIWEMENEFMGGPFVTFAIVNKEEGKLIFIDTFVYAPGKEKRDIVQQIEYIIKHSQLAT